MPGESSKEAMRRPVKAPIDLFAPAPAAHVEAGDTPEPIAPAPAARLEVRDAAPPTAPAPAGRAEVKAAPQTISTTKAEALKSWRNDNVTGRGSGFGHLGGGSAA